MRALLLSLLALACAPAVPTTAGSDAGTTDSGVPSDAGAVDAGATDGGAPVCTFGMDQTCNDNQIVSALWGSCRSDGTCECKPGYEVNPQTGRCRPTGSYACGDMTCDPGEFCVDRVHMRDAGNFSQWQCMPYFTCTAVGCACALQSFISASCVDPTCVQDAPEVRVRCDDLN